MSEQTPTLPPGHSGRMARARLSLNGLSVGDAFGEQFFRMANTLLIQFREAPPGPWEYTDDTAMARSGVDTLQKCGGIDQDQLAKYFATEFATQPWRGYGASMQQLLRRFEAGADWRAAARSMFGGTGSKGNGSAMRVAPVGAYFAEDSTDRVVDEAIKSAEVTHTHPEALAAAAATALAAAWAWNHRNAAETAASPAMLAWVAASTPDSITRERLEMLAGELWEGELDPLICTIGNGNSLLAEDTVPLCLWIAAHHPHSYENAIWAMIAAGGDADTNCAIVGGIVALATGRAGIPGQWLDRCEIHSGLAE
ncbi:MAG: ADP-ribosylglycohydrolase family protein [Candidatus Sumerlaeia bacterium]